MRQTHAANKFSQQLPGSRAMRANSKLYLLECADILLGPNRLGEGNRCHFASHVVLPATASIRVPLVAVLNLSSC
jgi:hypothetical protein